MASGACFFTCQVTACCKKFHSLRSLVSHMNLQHSGDKRLGLYCNVDGCTYMYNTVRMFRCHVTHRHSSYWENTSTSSVVSALSNDTPMDVDDDDDDDAGGGGINSHEPDSHDEVKVNSLLNNFAKHLAFLKLKIMGDFNFR